ncbi:MAG: hypothetical protein IJZ89_02275 [Clostridia bacterium]|nr:hypothetical protein [Clostridia bacterium]
MTRVTNNEMRNINGGATVYCPFCRKKFSDPNWIQKLFGYKISAKTQLNNHINLFFCPKR